MTRTRSQTNDGIVEVAWGIFRPRQRDGQWLIEIGRPILKCPHCGKEVCNVKTTGKETTIVNYPGRVQNFDDIHDQYASEHIC